MKAAARKINKIEIGTPYKHTLTGVEGKVTEVYATKTTEEIQIRYVDGNQMSKAWFPVSECKPVVAVRKTVKKPTTAKPKAVKKSTGSKT